jgi:ribokinase
MALRHAITGARLGKAAAVILVFGSLNVDVLVPMPALPRPGETVLGGDYRLLPGGKGANQALAARRAGADVVMAGAVGPDDFAEIALAPLRAAGVNVAAVRPVERPTGCALIMVGADGENLIAVASGANQTATSANVPDGLLGPAMTVVCQMEVPAEENWALIRRARAAGARTLLNLAPAAPVPTYVLSDIDVLIANRGEAATLGGEPVDIAPQLRQALVVTLGAAGSIAYQSSGEEIALPALTIEPVDTTGAGDTFVGVLAAALDRGLALTEALRRASAAAALACLARGAQSAMPDRAAIDAAVARLPPNHHART